MDLTTYELFGEMIRAAFDQRVLVEEDLFLTDEGLLTKLRQSQSPQIQKYLSLLTPKLKIEFNFEGAGEKTSASCARGGNSLVSGQALDYQRLAHLHGRCHSPRSGSAFSTGVSIQRLKRLAPIDGKTTAKNKEREKRCGTDGLAKKN